jgi:predicted esterase
MLAHVLPALPLAVLLLAPGANAQSASGSAQRPPSATDRAQLVSRADLVPAYRGVDQTYAARLPSAGPVRAAINRAFDRATLRFFSGDLAATVRSIADVRQMLAGTTLDTLARRTPLQRFIVRVAPFAWRASTAATDRARTDSLELMLRPLGIDSAATDSMSIRVEITPVQASSPRGARWSRTLVLPMGSRGPIRLAVAPSELRSLTPGRYLARAVRADAVADSSLSEEFAIVASPPDTVRATLAAAVAALAPAPAALEWTRALFLERLALLNGSPTDDQTAVRLADPTQVAAQLRGELAMLTRQRNPYANRAGDLWWQLAGRPATAGAPRAALAVRVIASTSVAQSPTPVPLIIALHGAGMDENGFADGYGNGLLLREAAARGMLVAAPATIAVQRTPALLDSLIATLARSYAVDSTRIYLLGHSMGAGAVTQLLQRTGHPFAAAVAIAGGAAITSAGGVPPVRYVGAALDPIIPAARVKQSASQSAASGVRAEYVEVADVGHTMVVTHVLGESLDWLLTHRRAP